MVPEVGRPTHGCSCRTSNCIWDRYGQDTFISGITMRACQVKIYKATPENSPIKQPLPATQDGTDHPYLATRV